MVPQQLQQIYGARVLEYGAEGPVLNKPQNATDILGEALQANADWVLLPIERVSEAFFELKSGLAGEALQKFANYRISLTIVGNCAHYAAASQSLRDFMREANRGRLIWFVADRAEFEQRLELLRSTLA